MFVFPLALRLRRRPEMVKVRIALDIDVDSDGVHCGDCLDCIERCPFYPRKCSDKLKPDSRSWFFGSVRLPACIESEKTAKIKRIVDLPFAPDNDHDLPDSEF